MTNWLFRKIDISSLVFFRIAFGLLALYKAVDFLDSTSRWKALTGGTEFNFTYYGFEWVQVLPPNFMCALCCLMGVLSVLIIIGYNYRLATFIYALAYTYIYLIEKAYYLNHAYLYAMLCFVMCLLPAHRAFSVDSQLHPSIKTQFIPYWPVFLLQFLMGIVYFYGGIAKLNPDWLRGIPLVYWLEGSSEEIPIIGHILDIDFVAVLMSYGGMLLDLTAVYFLSNKRTRGYFMVAVLFFHALNKVIFSIGIFPYLSVALSLMYFSPDWPRKLLHRLFPKYISLIPEQNEIRTAPSLVDELWQKRLIIGFIVVLGVYHILMPLRHFLIQGPTDWTEEGHRYSWHMMLRTKKGKGRFTVKIPSEDKTIKISTKDYLNKRQRKKLFTHPDMILQFAHFLRDKYEEKGYEGVEVYANVRSKFNGRDYAPLINPKVNLAQIASYKTMKHNEWILIRDDVYNYEHLSKKKKEKMLEEQLIEKNNQHIKSDTIEQQ